MRIRGVSFGGGGGAGGGGCMGCAGPAIILIVGVLVGAVWSANQFYSSPWRHFYLPDWAKVSAGGVVVFVIFTSAIILTTVSNTAAIWAAGLGSKRQNQTVHDETQARIQELAGVQRVESGAINTLLREKNDLRRELAQVDRKALPAPEEPRGVKFDPSILVELEEMDIVEAE
jgi:type VI protein secretion system component VasK